jgi:hypothetical protein
MNPEVRLRVLRRAAEIAGSPTNLMIQLGVDQHAWELWQSGRARVPQRVFLSAVDVILRDDIARATQDRRTGPRPHDPTEPQPPKPLSSGRSS